MDHAQSKVVNLAIGDDVNYIPFSVPNFIGSVLPNASNDTYRLIVSLAFLEFNISQMNVDLRRRDLFSCPSVGSKRGFQLTV